MSTMASVVSAIFILFSLSLSPSIAQKHYLRFLARLGFEYEWPDVEKSYKCSHDGCEYAMHGFWRVKDLEGHLATIHN